MCQLFLGMSGVLRESLDCEAWVSGVLPGLVKFSADWEVRCLGV